MNNRDIYLILCSLNDTITNLENDFSNGKCVDKYIPFDYKSLLFDYKTIYRKLIRKFKEGDFNV